MHEFEDLVSDSILLLHSAHPADDPRVRDLIARLYTFQRGYDCGFTHFRVIEALVARGHTFRFGYTDHPDVGLHAGLAESTGFVTVSDLLAPAIEPDPQDWDFEDERWLDLGYVDPPYLYCDAGTTLWRRMIEAGAVSGPDAEPLRHTSLAEAVLAVVRAAEAADDVELVALWHVLGRDELLAEATSEVPERVIAVREIREIAARTGALSFAVRAGLRPPPEVYADDELESWWSDDGEEPEFLRTYT